MDKKKLFIVVFIILGFLSFIMNNKNSKANYKVYFCKDKKYIFTEYNGKYYTNKFELKLSDLSSKNNSFKLLSFETNYKYKYDKELNDYENIKKVEESYYNFLIKDEKFIKLVSEVYKLNKSEIKPVITCIIKKESN